MNAMIQSLASEGWSEIVQALLHTFWEAALIAAALFLVLRRAANPVTRHRCCLLALAAVLLAGLCTWAVLDSRRSLQPQTATPTVAASAPVTGAPANAVGAKLTLTPMEVGRPGTPNTPPPASPAGEWVAWFALVWLAGSALMLARAARSFAGAGKLCRMARPLEDEAMLRVIEEARRKLGLARRIRAVVTEKLTSPAVAGILVPTLILPLSLLTALPPNQLQLIILHELAHIRRGDYFANLFQLLAESLLFFNPAVWWISRQLRHEREACCDAVAIALAGGERLEYARALARVAEHGLEDSLAATPAFADGRDRPGLADRVRRVLAPGARPQLRLTWRALAGSLVFGGTVFLLSALGTQWTVQAAARLLTPQERVDRIAATLKDLGQSPDSAVNQATKEITIQVRTADGSPLPRLRSLYSYVQTGNSGGVGPLLLDSNGVGKVAMKGNSTAYLGTWIEGYAPAGLGPISGFGTNASGRLELVLDRGFQISIQVLDQDSGKPVPGARVSYNYLYLGPNVSMDTPRTAVASDTGVVQLTNCAPLPLHLHVTMDGYDAAETAFDHVKPNEELKLHTRRALPIAGQVTDATTGQPISGASIYVIHGTDAPGLGDINPWLVHWRYGETKPSAVTDAGGHFTIDRLPQSGSYELLAQADGRAGAVLTDARPGQTNLTAALGPEVIVRGRIEGDLSFLWLQPGRRGHETNRPASINSEYYRSENGNRKSGYGNTVPVRVENGVGYFEYTNLVAGLATISIGGFEFTTNASGSVNDWVITLGDGPIAKKREVVLRFKHTAGGTPTGTVSLLLPGPMPHTGENQEAALTNGEARFQAPVGGDVAVTPGKLVGFWFNNQSVKIEDGTEPQIVTIPVIAAGAVYAEAREPDGSVAGDVLFAVRVVKPSPLQPSGALLDTGSGDASSGAPRHYVATPLPLGGTYQIIAWRRNNFAASDPVTLTEAEPDRKFTLQFRPGVRLPVQVFDPAGRPATNVDVEGSCVFDNHSFGLSSTNTDAAGRFEYDDCEPSSGKVRLTLHGPGMRGIIVEADLKKLPLSVHLEPGRKMSGQVLNKKTGKPVPQATVSASTADMDLIGRLPPEKTVTDDQGRFVLDTLGEANYFVNANLQNWGYGGTQAHAGGKKDLVIKMVPYGTPE
jgi:beta-lactamase regulating signal transducer with metallopeptidase domain/5-hydroxyisourate hydrolase-like protein (transthyretin family)